MLPLDSPRWATLKGSGSRTGELAARMLRDGSAANFAELYHQACHQLTVGEVAYAVVPHVIGLAREMPLAEQVWPLVIAGTVAACRVANPEHSPPVPADLRADFEASNVEALRLAAAALGHAELDPEQTLQLLAVVAGLHGRGELAIQLFMCVPGEELACPSCGERLKAGVQGLNLS